MSVPSPYWLIVMNVVLGAVVLICCAAVGIGILKELAAKKKKKAELAKLDREVADLVASYRDGHAFNLPGLGVTMADGGEDVRKKDEQ